MADDITLTDFYGNGRVLAAKDVSGVLYMRHAFSVWNGVGYDDIALGRQGPAASLPVTLDTTHVVTEDAAAAADPIGGHLIARRKDTLSAAQVSTDGDVIALNATAKGQLHVYTESSSGLADNAAFTDGTSVVVPAGYIYDEVAGTALTENDVGAARINVNRSQIHVIEDGATRGRYVTVTAGGELTATGNLVDNAGFTDGTTRLFMGGFIYDEAAGTALTENDGAAARINANRAQVHVFEDGATRGRYATVTANGQLKSQPDPNLTTPASAATTSITLGGTSQQALAANTARKYLFIQNLATEALGVRFGASATLDTPSIILAPGASAGDGRGASLTFEGMAVPSGTVNVIAATTGSKFVCLEG